jgi:hypothetical protein
VVVLSCAGELQGTADDYPCAFQGAASCTSAAQGGGTSGGAGPMGGANPGSGGGGALPPDDQCLEGVFSTACAVACHKPGAGVALGESLNLTGGNYGMKMAGVPATYQGVTDPSTCKAGALLIDPTTNAESVLLKKLAGTQSCGFAMPIGAPLTPAQLACITDWVMKF